MPSSKINIYFIGIGGIGVSALAKHYLKLGHRVAGSDLCSSEITEELRKEGAKIIIGKNCGKNLSKNINLVIYSPAVNSENFELKKAKELKIKCLSYPEALGELTKENFTIAVSGTHGKSSTTSMAALILAKAKLDPTVIVGTKIKQFQNSNYKYGKKKYLIIEACEYKDSFLNYSPDIIAITNIEKDHLDYFKNLKNILKSFKKFINLLPKEGALIINKEDKNTKKILGNKNAISFSINQPEAKKIKKILKIPGEHNIYNALAALAIARLLKIPDIISFKALSEYKASWRRFDERKEIINGKKRIIISDYGHHPTEVNATLQAAKEKYPNKKIWCIFQPHQYQRTHYLFDDFVKIFQNNKLDKILITDIYDVVGREEKNIRKKINSGKLIEKIKKSWVEYLPQKKILKYIKKNSKNFDILLIMGAGDIYEIDKQFSK